MSKLKQAISFLGLILAFNIAGYSQAADLFFSEYHEDGNDKYVEIFNGTGADVDLSNYRIDIEQNDGAEINQSVVLNGMLADGDVYIICNTISVQAIKDEADLENNSIAIFNGDDRIRLVNTNTDALIDIIGEIGNRSNWSGILESAGLRRNSDVAMGNSGDWANTYQAEWISFASDDFSDLGMHTFNGGGNQGGGGMQNIVASDLFISEYGEGWSTENYIEIFNGTGADVDLSEYTVKISPRDGFLDDPTAYELTFAQGDIIKNLEVIVIANADANDAELNAPGVRQEVGFDFDGSQAVALYKNGVMIDIFGIEDGSTRDIDRLETFNAVAVRKPNITEGNPIFQGPGGSYGTAEINSEWENWGEFESGDEYYGNIGTHVFGGIEYPSGREQLYMGYFDNNTLEPWTVFDNASRRTWSIGSFFGSSYAEANNYDSGDEGAEDWLISFPIDTRRFENSELELIFQRAFGRADLVDICVSTDYDGVSNPNDFTWVQTGAIYDPGNPSFDWYPTTVSLDQYPGREVYIAVKYVESDFQTAGGTVERFSIDNVHLITGEVQNVPATNIQITDVRPAIPFAGLNFELVIETVDANGTPMPVDQDTDLTVALEAGSGNLTGEINITMPAGDFEYVAVVQYDQMEIIDISVSDVAGGLTQDLVEDIEVVRAPEEVVATSFYQKGFVNLPHAPFEFEVLDRRGNIDTRFNEMPCELIVYRNGFSVNSFETRSVNGRVIFDDVVFQNVGDLEVVCNASGLMSDPISVEILSEPFVSFFNVPKYMITHIGDDGFGERLPVWSMVSIFGLHPNTEYRFYTGAVPTDFAGDQEGLNNASTLANTVLMDADGDQAEMWYRGMSGNYSLDWTPAGCDDNLPVNRQTYSTFVSDENGEILLPVNLYTDGNNFFIPEDDLQFWWTITLGDETGTTLNRYQSFDFTTGKTLSPDGNVENAYRATGIYDMRSNLEPLSLIFFYNQNFEVVSSAMVQGDGGYMQDFGSFDPQTCEVDFWFSHQGPDFFRDIDGYRNNDGSMIFDEIDGAWATFLPNFNSEFGTTEATDTRVEFIEYYDFEGNYIDGMSNESGVWDGISTINPNGGIDNPINFRTPKITLTSFVGIDEFCNTEGAHLISWEAGAVTDVDIYVDTYDEFGNFLNSELLFNDIPAVNDPEEDDRAGSIEWVIPRGEYSEDFIEIRMTTGDGELNETSGIFQLFDAPSFQTTSVSVVKCEGEDNLFVCTATGSEVQYQWYKDGEMLPGETETGLLIEDLDHTASGVYNCLVTNQNSTICGDYFTEDMVLYVARNTEITTQPESKGAVQGGTARFYFDSHTTGVPPTFQVDIQWYKGNVALEDDERIAGANSNMLTIKDVETTDFTSANDNYYAVIEGKCESATTTQVDLVEANFTIDEQPTDQVACQGGSFELTVAATTTNQEALMYQWFKDGMALTNNSNVFGVNTNKLTVTNANGTNGGVYFCNIMLDGQGFAVSSDDATVAITEAPEITTDLEDTYDLKVGDALNLAIAATGGGTLSYQWFKDGQEITGETAENFAIASLTPDDEGVYSVTVANECTAISSNSSTVTVTQSGDINLSVISSTESGYELHAPAPNPVRDNASIKFVLPEANQVTMKLISATGANITLIENTYFGENENIYEINVDELNLTNGTYMIYFESGDAILTQKIVINR